MTPLYHGGLFRKLPSWWERLIGRVRRWFRRT